VNSSFIYDNLIYSVCGGGIVNYNQDGIYAGNNHFVHNTVMITPGAGKYAIGCHTGSVNNIIANNILIGRESPSNIVDFDSESVVQTVLDYNAYYKPGSTNDWFTDGNNVYSLSQWISTYNYDKDSISLTGPNEVFVNISSLNFTEIPTSPTIGAGNPIYSIINGVFIPDILGVPRPQNGKVDMGAFQNGTGGSNPFTTTQGSTSSQSTSSQSTTSGNSVPNNASLISIYWIFIVILMITLSSL